jgi:hypothetical protein
MKDSLKGLPMSLSKRYFERQPTAADRLENARCHVRRALCAADEGEPTFDTLDRISRALVAATSELERLAIDLDTHANLERKVS